MPYIEAGMRKSFDSEIDSLVKRLLEPYGASYPGSVNYCLSRIVWELWKADPCYATGNDLMGVLECVKQEFYRRMLGPYEDEKRAHNGDIA